MKKLKSIILYECMTSFKYIWIFYTIQYTLLVLITLLIATILGNFDNIGTNGLEMNTMIYVGILGLLGFNEDFKMLIQNGFNRKYIFIATFSMFCFISGTMALVDTLIGNMLHHLNNNYSSVFGGLYGYENILMNWLWLFLVYVSVCCLLYVFILGLNKVGKIKSLYLSVGGVGLIGMMIALFRYVFSTDTLKNVLLFFTKSMGFMMDGSINYLFPVITFVLLIFILGIGSYAIIRKTELK